MVDSFECLSVHMCAKSAALLHVCFRPFAFVHVGASFSSSSSFLWESALVWKQHHPSASRCLPLINLLITVISDSFHHYRFHTTHCLFSTQPFLERTSHTYTHIYKYTHRNTQRPGCWSHTPLPSPLQSAIHHRATGEEREKGERKRLERGERERQNDQKTKERVATSVFFALSWASLNPHHAHTLAAPDETRYVKPESLKGNHFLEGQLAHMRV